MQLPVPCPNKQDNAFFMCAKCYVMETDLEKPTKRVSALIPARLYRFKYPAPPPFFISKLTPHLHRPTYYPI